MEAEPIPRSAKWRAFWYGVLALFLGRQAAMLWIVVAAIGSVNRLVDPHEPQAQFVGIAAAQTQLVFGLVAFVSTFGCWVTLGLVGRTLRPERYGPRTMVWGLIPLLFRLKQTPPKFVGSPS